MSKTYKECQVCGKTYEACPYCDSQKDFYAWRTVVCCEEHMAYHIPIISYIRHLISKDKAREDLLNAEKHYGKITYAPEIVNVVDEIKAEDTTESTMRKVSSQPKADNTQVKTINRTSSKKRIKK